VRLIKGHLFIFLLLVRIVGFGQSVPPTKNFTSVDYQAGSQNWSISQSDDKIIFVANNNGLLEYNGARWKLYPSPNETIMRSVNAINERIYTGCYMEFGFWERNEEGILVYTSISSDLDIEMIEDEEFWSIIEIDEWILFQSLNRIYIVNRYDHSVSLIESDKVINKMFEVDGEVYFHRLHDGIYKIINGADQFFLNDPVIKSNELVEMFKIEGKLIFLTKNHGFYYYDGSALKEWGNSQDHLVGLSIYSALRLANGSFALGTISNGLLCFNVNEGVTSKINQENALINNTVLSIFEDVDHNIWLGLDNGCSFINQHSPINVYEDTRGIIGSVYTSAAFDGILYLGTNQGLFYKPLHSDGEFKLLEGTQGQVWSLNIIEETLFCGHHSGTYVIEGNKALRVADVLGTWNVKALDDQNDKIIQGNYDGLYLLEKSKGEWSLKTKISGFDYSSRSYEVLDRNIFVNHEYRGVFHLTVNDTYDKIEEVRLDTLLKGANSGLSKHKGDILYAFKKGIFIYDTLTKSFEKDSILSTSYSEDNYSSGRIVTNEPKDRFWIFTKSHLISVSSDGLVDKPKMVKLPIGLDVRRDVVEYENITSIPDNDSYLIGTRYGYLELDPGNLDIGDLNIYIDQIINSENRQDQATQSLVNFAEDSRFTVDQNSFYFSFYTPAYYDYLETQYQFQLDGLYDGWSGWSSQSDVYLENLLPGKYTFKVRAKIGDKTSQNIASYTFQIDKPWYLSDIWLAIYVVFLIAFFILTHNLYRRYYHKKQGKILEKSQRELEMERLKNEKEIIKIKNEQLEKSYKDKSHELAASTMNIVRKNELLTEIKTKLEEIPDKKSIGPVLKIINKHLNHSGNWDLFKEAFDNADAEFFKKINAVHPELSPNDLKLCAYLRLNLSTKEIAPLFNISVRSVEIKRYRLRKKLGLDSNENLTNYILNL
jgi:AraC family chitin signaling transcriptional activator